MYTNWMQPQPGGPPGGGMDGGNLQMGRGAQPGAYFGGGTMDSPTPMAMGMNAPMQQPRPAFNAGVGMDARGIASTVQQPLSIPGAGGGQFSPRAPMPNGPSMGGGGLDRMGGNPVYSPMAPASGAPPQQYSPMAPSPSLPPTGGAAMAAPRQNLRPLQFNGRAGGLFGMGGGR